jgi:hypothetical protein
MRLCELKRSWRSGHVYSTGALSNKVGVFLGLVEALFKRKTVS